MASRHDGLRQTAKRAQRHRRAEKRTVTGMANSLRTEIQVILSERSASAEVLRQRQETCAGEISGAAKKFPENCVLPSAALSLRIVSALRAAEWSGNVFPRVGRS